MVLFLLLLAVLPPHAAACSVCFGDPTSPAAKGLAMGVIALLGVVLVVLGGLAAFFIYLARRAAATEAANQSENNRADSL